MSKIPVSADMFWWFFNTLADQILKQESIPEGCLPPDFLVPVGESGQHPWMQTIKNITLPQTSFAGGNY